LGNPRIFIGAGETSGDLHGANLVRALQRLAPEAELVGLGGAVEVVSVTELLRRKVALDGYYNPRAATLIVTKSP